jgi:hypothetical protein
MAIDNFIPSVWSARLLQNLHNSLVYGQSGVINRDYEGEIREAGNTVKINALGAVSVGTYTKNSDMNAPETLTDAQLSLLIDQSKYFNFQIDDVDKAQQKPKVMSEAMREAAYALADVADQYIAGLYTGVDAGNLIGTTAAPKSDLGDAGKPYEYLVQLAVILDEDKVPAAGRWVIVPPWFHGLLLQDQKFVGTGGSNAEATLRNGMVGEAAGFSIIKSNNVPNTTSAKYRIIAGHPMAWSYAEQINGVEAYRPERRFADAVKGLHVYGAKIVRPTALAVLTANRPS